MVGVPGHDVRDFEFAQAMGIPVKRVVVGSDGDTSDITSLQQVQEEEGTMINSGFLDGMNIHDATSKIMDYMEEHEQGKRAVTFHLRDWIFSRQRYWGEPIPMVFCLRCAGENISYWDTDSAQSEASKLQSSEKFNGLIDDIKDSMVGWFPLKNDDLPLELPYIESYEPGESGESPLAGITSWTEVVCPNCGASAQRETDTMPNWAGSCWYFFQFAISQKNRSEKDLFGALEKEGKHWLPIDWYIGGSEHAVLHLLYSRFWMHALHDMGYINFREPFTRLRNVGMLIAEDGHKMSKSKGNVINPDHTIQQYGADVLRTYVMFMAPFDQEVRWSSKTLQGLSRFLVRVWRIYHNSAKVTKTGDVSNKQLVSELQTLILKISQDIPNVKFNTPIAACMEFLNLWEKTQGGLVIEHAKKYLQMLAPFAPYITEELWRTVCEESSSIHTSQWPKPDTSVIEEKDVIIPVQINGKVREKIVLPAQEVSEEIVTKKALTSEKVQKWIGGKAYKFIYVPGKILNIVIM